MQAEAQRGVSTRLSAGRLEGISVPDLFWALSTARATGVLQMTAGSVEKRVYFASGQITFAASTDPNDRLGELLLRQGTIRLDHFERAVARLTEGRRLGTVLVESGQLSPENLISAVRDQVRHIIWSLIPWEDGEYRFDEGPPATDEIVTLTVDTASMLLHGMRSIRPFQRIRRSVGPSNTRYQAVESWREAARGLDLTDGERQLLERLDGLGETVESLCRDVFLSNFEIHQALWAFKVLGLARECGCATVPHTEDTVDRGRLDNDGIGKLLIRLARANETGVLQVTRGVAERTFHLREGRLVFATSNNIDDGLVAYLLRRGMISLRDREETARRQLSNKRVGQILLEMGVIDETELANLIREHQTEILFDTFRWDDGGWAWLSGELPTIESIVLDRTVEDLVFSGVRRVASWSRVREGCGGFSTRLELTASYLEILDRMNIAGEDWELITLLRTPTTPFELCRALSVGDFRVCQTLWALRLLEAVDEAPLDDALEAVLGGIGANAIAREASRAALSEPESPPQPIAPAAIDAEATFEVTTVQEMTPDAPADDRAVPASTWTGPAEETPTPWAWRESEDGPAAVEVSDVTERGEVINETWRLAGDEVRPPEPAAPADLAAAVPDLAAAVPDLAAAVPDLAAAVPDLAAAVPDLAAEESAFSLVPEGKRADDGEPDTLANAAAVAALFEIPAPDLRESHAFAMDLPDPGPAQAEPHDEAPDRIGAQRNDALDSDRDDFAAAGGDETDWDGPAASEQPWALEEPEIAADASAETSIISGAAAAAVVDAHEPQAGTDAAPAWSAPTAIDAHEPRAGTDAAPAGSAATGLDLEIARFVERHKLVFRVIRSEVGAGAFNFVRSCRSALASGIGDVLAEAEMQPDGGWSVDELGQMIRARRLESVPEAFRSLIEQEVAMLRTQIGERRTRALLEQVESK